MSNTTSTGGQRIVSLDLLRGLAVAGMILVDSPGSWSKVYPPLEHAAWHGFTAADLVFPTFLFCAGMAVGLMVPRMRVEDLAEPRLRREHLVVQKYRPGRGHGRRGIAPRPGRKEWNFPQ